MFQKLNKKMIINLVESFREPSYKAIFVDLKKNKYSNVLDKITFIYNLMLLKNFLIFGKTLQISQLERYSPLFLERRKNPDICMFKA